MAHRKQIQISKKEKKLGKGGVSSGSTATDLSVSVDPTTEEPVTRCKRKPVKAKQSSDIEPTPSSSTVQSVSKDPELPKYHKKATTRGKRKKKTVEKAKTSYENEEGRTIWICPSCGMEDDGLRPMIGCDICDEWYHWDCLGITAEPDEELWFCPTCDNTSAERKKGKRKKRFIWHKVRKATPE